MIDFPKYNEDDTFADVLDDCNHCLKKHDLQMGFMEMDSTDYVFVVHKVCDREKVGQLIDNIGYYYFETGEEHAEIQRQIEEERCAAIPYDMTGLLFWLVILLLCPLFSYVTYRGFLKDGFSFWVIFIGITNLGFYYWSIVSIVITNLGFYYWSIVSIVGEFSLYRNARKKKNIKL
ncbi:MAG: hypothetical protein CSA42_08615 [Gammaproteobacteria bacterium]|nr:MAG: hypothetical protein CSA42_08615 [Gammaproteobacteria bacterium]